MTSELIDYIKQIKGFENSPDKFYQVVVGDGDFVPSIKMMEDINEQFKKYKEMGVLKSTFIITDDFIKIEGEKDD